MISAADQAHLAEAIELAKRGLYTTTPNPRVGCVIARGDQVLGRGWHQWAGQDHAEVRALKDAGGDAAGATAYVSLEPCSIHGRTPPCADALAAAGIKRVVVGALDPDPRVNGNGLKQLKAAGIAVDLANDEGAQDLNLGHRQRMALARPWVRVKMAASLDGRTAMASGESQWITGPEARQDVQRWRARSCAVITGIGTVLADDPKLNVRDERFASDGRLRQPLRVIVDSRLRSPALGADLPSARRRSDCPRRRSKRRPPQGGVPPLRHGASGSGAIAGPLGGPRVQRGAGRSRADPRRGLPQGRPLRRAHPLSRAKVSRGRGPALAGLAS